VGDRFLLPALNALPAYLVMTRRLRAGDRWRALQAMAAWAVSAAVFGTVLFALWPSPPDRVVLNGPAYRDQMFLWIRTGAGAEGRPEAFIPQHFLHLVAFVALSLATASAASLVMGAVLMNYMSFYVASLARAGAPAWAVVALGWQPWAICRVAAFAVLGVVLAEPLLARVQRRAALPWPRPWLAWAAAGLVADIVLKAALAPTWRLALSRVLP
jgi:hypothetical protein